MCENGIHFCAESPLDCFEFYDMKDCVVTEVKVEADTEEDDELAQWQIH